MFDAESVFDIYEKQLNAAPVPPSQRTANVISVELEQTLLRCLEREPNLRPQSVSELRVSLLASPSASAWTAEARADWSARYPGTEIPKRAEPEPKKSSP